VQADTLVALTSLSVHATGGAGSANPCMFPSELCCLLIACCVSVCSSMLYVCASSVCRVCVTTSSVYIERVCACIKCASSVCVERASSVHRACVSSVHQVYLVSSACASCSYVQTTPCANYSVLLSLSSRPLRIVLLLRSPCVMCEALGRMWYGQCT
jgi:hypothetical protein